ncbi:MAG: hypothetical protein IKI93_15515, partial [Clostridia bacterium]|nr:hypothetical protein [Clostridia bacterium]
MSDEKHIYTLKEIADELKVDKQKVYRFVIRNHISEVHHEVLRDVLHCDSDFGKNGVKYYDKAARERILYGFGSKSTSKSTSSTSDEVHHKTVLMQNEALQNAPEVHHDVVENETKKQSESEIEFLRNQIIRMNEQISSQNEQMRQQGEVIASLNRELEKEREHNREKDKLLMETLSKLTETQAALAVGQSAEKQKELAETLI